MRVVVDTNVWISGLIVPDSAPGAILEAARRGHVHVVASWELAAELATVARRPKLARYAVTEDDVEDLLVLLAPLLPAVDVEVEVRDPRDAPVVAAAIAGGAEAIVTGDADLLDDGELRAWLGERGVAVLTPVRFLETLGS